MARVCGINGFFCLESKREILLEEREVRYLLQLSSLILILTFAFAETIRHRGVKGHVSRVLLRNLLTPGAHLHT